MGTPTIGQVINMMKEAEMDALAMPWANARAVHLLAVWRMTPVEVGNGQEEGYDTVQWQPINVYSERRNIGTFFLSCNTCKDSEAVLGRMH